MFGGDLAFNIDSTKVGMSTANNAMYFVFERVLVVSCCIPSQGHTPTKARLGHSAISSQGYFSLTARPASTTNWPSKKNFGFRGVSTQGTPSPTLTWQVQFGWSSGLHSFGHLADRKWGLVAVWMNEPASQTTSQWDDLGSWFNLLHHKAPNWAERKLILHSTVMRSLGLKAFTLASGAIWYL